MGTAEHSHTWTVLIGTILSLTRWYAFNLFGQFLKSHMIRTSEKWCELVQEELQKTTEFGLFSPGPVLAFRNESPHIELLKQPTTSFNWQKMESETKIVGPSFGQHVGIFDHWIRTIFVTFQTNFRRKFPVATHRRVSCWLTEVLILNASRSHKRRFFSSEDEEIIQTRKNVAQTVTNLFQRELLTVSPKPFTTKSPCSFLPAQFLTYSKAGSADWNVHLLSGILMLFWAPLPNSSH